MSLINQMLRDLESRRAQAQGSEPSGALDNLQWPATPGMSGKAPGGLRAVNWLRLGGIVAVFAILLSAYLWYSRATPLNTTPETVVQAPTPAVPPTAQPVTGGEVAEEAPAMQQAPQASPEDEDRAAPALAAQEVPAAAEPPATPVATVVAAPPVESTPVAQTQQEAKPVSTAGAAPPREPRVARAEGQAPPPAPHIKKPSVQGPTQLAERSYQEAVEALQNGRIAEAQQGLREALAQQPRHHPSRELLAEIYLRNGQTGEAENLLAAGAMLDPRYTLFSKLHARLLVDRGDTSAALAVLEDKAASAAQDAEYQAFLAALYQRMERHNDAIAIYRKVLASEPRQGVWWMGLGISLEATGQQPEALEAYRHAQATGNLAPAVLDFVKGRISILKGRL